MSLIPVTPPPITTYLSLCYRPRNARTTASKNTTPKPRLKSKLSPSPGCLRLKAQAWNLTSPGSQKLSLSRSFQAKLGPHITIYADNQAIIQAIANPKAKSSQYIIEELLHLMEECKGAFDACTMETPISVKVAWISAHSGVTGNELADDDAKLAAMGKMSVPIALSELLCKRLLVNTSTLKQDFTDKLRRKWGSRWRNSPHHFHICYDMAFQQVIIITFNLILSGGTYLIWKISSYSWRIIFHLITIWSCWHFYKIQGLAHGTHMPDTC